MTERHERRVDELVELSSREMEQVQGGTITTDGSADTQRWYAGYVRIPPA